jgi:hypothetical protein
MAEPCGEHGERVRFSMPSAAALGTGWTKWIRQSFDAMGNVIEVARIETCTMPHGSRLDPTGARHYSACMMDDVLVEVDARTFKVSRHFLLGTGKERGMNGAPGGHAMHMSELSCSPTWAQPSIDGNRVFVACNKADEIVEIDVPGWTLVRRIPAGPGVYNLGVSRDGKLIASNKRGESISIFDVATAKELARVPTRAPIVHGVAVSSDSRFAFVSEEAIGQTPGVVEIISLVDSRAPGVSRWSPGRRPRLPEDRTGMGSAARRRQEPLPAAAAEVVPGQTPLPSRDPAGCRGFALLAIYLPTRTFSSAFSIEPVGWRRRRFATMGE